MSVHTYSSPESNRATCVSFFPLQEAASVGSKQVFRKGLISRAASGKMAGSGANKQVQLVDVLIYLFFFLGENVYLSCSVYYYQIEFRLGN